MDENHIELSDDDEKITQLLTASETEMNDDSVGVKKSKKIADGRPCL